MSSRSSACSWVIAPTRRPIRTPRYLLSMNRRPSDRVTVLAFGHRASPSAAQSSRPRCCTGTPLPITDKNPKASEKGRLNCIAWGRFVLAGRCDGARRYIVSCLILGALGSCSSRAKKGAAIARRRIVCTRHARWPSISRNRSAVTDLIFLPVTKAALEGETSPLDLLIEKWSRNLGLVFK